MMICAFYYVRRHFFSLNAALLTFNFLYFQVKFVAYIIILCCFFSFFFATGLRNIVNAVLRTSSNTGKYVQKSRYGIPIFQNRNNALVGDRKTIIDINTIDIDLSPKAVERDEALANIADNVVDENDLKDKQEGTENEKTAALVDSGEEPCEMRKFIVFQCLYGQNCRGWGDRQKGIISSYLLALLTNRSFVVIHNSPCDISEFLVPNTYNWTSCSDYVLNIPESLTQTLIYFENKIFRDSIRHTDFEAHFQKQVIIIRTNEIWNEDILAHPLASVNIPWALGKSRWEVDKLVLERLFRPRKALEQEIEMYMKNVRESQQLICSHIRVGKNPSMPSDVQRRAGPPNVSTIFRFLKTFDIPAKYVIYVASDSDEVRESAKRNFTNSFTVDLPIIHVDRYRSQKAIACKGLYSVLLEQYLLSKCDVLLVTRSGLGVIAAYMSDNLQDLFLFDLNSQAIVKVTRNEIKDYYRMWFKGRQLSQNCVMPFLNPCYA